MVDPSSRNLVDMIVNGINVVTIIYIQAVIFRRKAAIK